MADHFDGGVGRGPIDDDMLGWMGLGDDTLQTAGHGGGCVVGRSYDGDGWHRLFLMY